MKVTPEQKRAVVNGSPTSWLGCRENGEGGQTMQALARRGLAEVKTVRKPWRRMVYRLTRAGQSLRAEWALAELERPVEYVNVVTRCEHCDDVQENSTDGGSCGRCGLTVHAIQVPA